MHFSKSLLAATALLGACSETPTDTTADATTAATATTNGASTPFAHAEMINASSQSAGSVVIAPSGESMVMQLTVNGLTPGVHGIHFHTVGSCETPAFTSAGAHLNPHNKMHGHENPQGSHFGDLPNITAGADGKAEVSVPLNMPRTELEQYLLDGDGTAIVVHAGPDDYRTDPSGNSGDRIACGVLARS